MILGEERIRELCDVRSAARRGHPFIQPFDPEQLNPSSYDLRLGNEACIYVRGESVAREYENRAASGDWSVVSSRQLPESSGWLDAKRPNASMRFRMSSHGFRVDPGRIYLMHTVEVVAPDLHHVAVVDGKSSLGRLGLVVHATAGYIDPGFRGQVTLEVAALGEPVIVYPGMRIAQVRFQPLFGECRSYEERGHYTGEASMGPVPSRSYQQFERAPLKTEPAPPPVEEHLCAQPCHGGEDWCTKPQGHAGPCG